MELFLILLIILILFLYPVLKAGFKIWMQMRQMKKNFEKGQHSAYGNSGYGSYYGTSNDDRNRHRHSEKIFSSTDGEYVDFEEIFEERIVSEYTETRDAEPRVSDAKYEEIR